MTKRLRADENERGQKRVKTSNPTPTHPTWPLLQAYYRDVSTLRQFLLSPSAGLPADVRQTIKYCGSSLDDDATLVHLLDSAIVGVPSSPQIAFSQRDLSEHIKQLALLKGEVLQRGRFTQTQIVDFVIWHLIGKDSWNRKYHLLSHGFYSRIASAKGADVQVVPGAPGVLVAHHNPYVEALREHPWTALCRLVGSRADEVLSRLLLQCGVFVPVGMSGNLSQISGIAMYKLKRKSNGEGRGEQTGGVRVHLVSHRMVLRRPALGANGNVVFGLGPKHVLNVYRDLEDSGQTRHVLKFVFPRQFRLQNVFAETSIAYSKAPGHSFRRKTLNALKLQMHAMLLTTEYNKVQTVLYNVHRAFSITAQKSRSLIRALPRQPRDQLIIGQLFHIRNGGIELIVVYPETVEELINLASALIRRRKHIGRQMIPFECEVSRAQVRWCVNPIPFSIS
ncbi:hypothetical protein K470DRAFT_210248 [Piedraia hortae CBS 480.64]|uniref:Telomerase reverse transcriptase n=1 Tax=Piedraia hortae CBS 480.64 TaxID=1314780 RepID=A0A6A7C8S1_9PEZI|nr:hypothetical protein K470DRAFT_210248 [Piedraia hortae CBS 480.64]